MNLKDLDPLYIRKNVTYVNQTSKLFDKKVIDNMMYGCSDKDKCEAMLKKVMQYPTISKLYKNMDIYTKESGLLGENLSGGQRQGEYDRRIYQSITYFGIGRTDKCVRSDIEKRGDTNDNGFQTIQAVYIDYNA